MFGYYVLGGVVLLFLIGGGFAAYLWRVEQKLFRPQTTALRQGVTEEELEAFVAEMLALSAEFTGLGDERSQHEEELRWWLSQGASFKTVRAYVDIKLMYWQQYSEGLMDIPSLKQRIQELPETLSPHMERPPFASEPFTQSVLRAVRALGSNAYGVTIRSVLVRWLQKDVSYGSIYATLEDLEESGFVSSYDWASDLEKRGGRSKQMYVITRIGEERFQQDRKF